MANVKQHWQKLFLEAIQQAETSKDIGVIRVFAGIVKAALPVVVGAAPKPPSVQSMYKGMLMSYVRSQGWSSLIKGSDYHEQQFGTYYYIDTSANPLQTADWPWIDLSDIVAELNRLRESGE